MWVGAFHPLGTNDIVLNRKLLGSLTSQKQKAHVFAILVHEYLHSLGYVDERRVRRLTYHVCAESFGKTHPATQVALAGPWTELTDDEYEEMGAELDLELVKDFEKIEAGYII